MKKISKEQFYSRQPQYPSEYPSDAFYFQLANILKSDIAREDLLPSYPEMVVDHAVLCLMGYYQDIISDAGLWRSMVDACRRLYGKTLPFYGDPEGYVDYELNREDVRFVVWYALCMYSAERRVCSPFDEEIIRCADRLYERLEALYDDAPEPEEYNLVRELELENAEDSEQIWHLGSWLFLHSYLLPPAFALTLAQIVSEPGLNDPDNLGALRERIDKAMLEDPTGPLALYIGEWLKLIVNRDFSVVGSQLTAQKEEIPAPDDRHPYYVAFTAATGGREIAYFADYESLNKFFIEGLGWEAGQEHLSNLRADRDFVLLVNPRKGMLLARNVARCIADPENPLYDKEYASTHSIDLLTERGVCPADLLKYIYARSWLPDATFPGTDTRELVKENHDFIARLYLQQFYRGD